MESDDDALSLNDVARVLNVRPDYVASLASTGELSSLGPHAPGSFRRSEVMALRRKMDAKARAALSEMARFSVEWGLD